MADQAPLSMAGTRIRFFHTAYADYLFHFAYDPDRAAVCGDAIELRRLSLRSTWLAVVAGKALPMVQRWVIREDCHAILSNKRDRDIIYAYKNLIEEGNNSDDLVYRGDPGRYNAVLSSIRSAAAIARLDLPPIGVQSKVAQTDLQFSQTHSAIWLLWQAALKKSPLQVPNSPGRCEISPDSGLDVSVLQFLGW